MDAKQFRKLDELFAKAVETPAEQREALIVAECGDDTELAYKLRGMLKADMAATKRVMSIIDGEQAGDDNDIGRVIGAYRIEHVLGSGAMGVVYRARRADGAYDQEVALKLVAGRFADPDLRSRFLRERQVLATLQHRGIARLLDGGVTDDGAPFLVMEYVPGRPLTAYCDDNHLDITQRLVLFEKVCDAVRHAHANLIVHRDLKPAHILVDEQGQPKLLDFGIAAVLDSAKEADATQTQLRRFTPQYASPEQLTGGSVTTSADVYALGVILYELLAGRLPYEVSTGASDLERRLICETLPAPPSHAATRASGGQSDPEAIAANRRVTPRRLRRQLSGDLDRVVMTALRKKPTRRYGSADALLEDLRRYRRGQPISAQPDTLSYRLRKFVGRHKLPAAAAAVVVMSLIGATAVSLNYAFQANRQAAIATAVVDFLRDDVLGKADPAQEADRNIRLRTVLDRAADSIGERFGDEPLVQAALRSTLGSAYSGLGEFDVARQHLEQAYALRSEHLGSSSADAIESRSAVAEAMIEAGDYDDAAAIVAELVTSTPDKLGSEHPVTLAALKLEALVHDGLGDYGKAAAAMSVALDQHRNALGPRHPDTLTVENDLALIFVDAGNYDAAEPLLRSVLAARREVLGATHPHTLLSHASLGYLLTHSGRPREAEPELNAVVSSADRILGEDHPNTAAYLNLLADSLRGQERFDEALQVSRRALRIQREALGNEHPQTRISIVMNGVLLQALGRLAEAEVFLRESHELAVRTLGADHPSALIAGNNLASLQLDAGHAEAAEELARDTVLQAKSALPDGYWLIGAFQTNHGRALLEIGQFSEAEAVLNEASGALSSALGADHERVARVQELLDQLPQRSDN